MENWLATNPLPGMILWIMLYISDYYMTIYTARGYREIDHFKFEGSFELTPQYQKDIDALKPVSKLYIIMLVVYTLIILLIWWFFKFLLNLTWAYLLYLGMFLLLEVAVHLRHLRNSFMIREIRKNGGVEGQVIYRKWFSYTASAHEFHTFGGLLSARRPVDIQYILPGRRADVLWNRTQTHEAGKEGKVHVHTGESKSTMNILYEDKDILIINKPAGLSVLPEGWEPDAPYIVKMLEEKYENPSTDSGQRIWVIHRLDKSTSGVLAFALNAEAHRALSIQFEKHEVEKVYRAITVGAPPWKERITKFPLRVNVGNKHRTKVDDKNGVRSETIFKVLSWNQTSYELAEGAALIEARPMTGRTHQIRVHAYALGYPLLGDILYSSPETDIISRPALHAHSLSFNHPATNERVIFTVPYPSDFKRALERLDL